MTASTLDTVTRRTTSSLITAYQKWISPHKGFVCAHRVLHRGESCSQYAKRVILEQGVWNAIPLMQERFEDCKVANEILQTRRERQRRQQFRRSLPPESQHTQPSDLPPDATASPDIEPPIAGLGAGETVMTRRKPCQEHTCGSGECRSANCSDALDCAGAFSDVADCSSDCAAFDWSGCDRSNLDCTLSDCSVLDCSSMDCSSMDCSSMDFGSCG
ncbi:MAG: membrane protein insertion efficiency factor YidD [Leptolyngbyaceae cyanobacterium bins.349]|nr:membrane protein insertion efficiency factor YidD [Leptolyngbyaceae cyanobacterium bins.349]